jgi:hypothetical protein
MHDLEFLPYESSKDAYEAQAAMLLDAAMAMEEWALWRFKWEHARYRGKGLEAVVPHELTIDDAREVAARSQGFQDWAHLTTFAATIASDDKAKRFEEAVNCVVAGDIDRLRQMLDAAPDLVCARSSRRHRATLLHYIAANGVENGRQKTPSNAVEIARLLLDRGAEVDALAEMYDAKCTTMSMLVSSCHPAEAGLQVPLVETLLDFGAAFDGEGTNWQSAVLTALCFGYLPAAQALARRGAPLEHVAVAAGLGKLEETRRLYAASDEDSRQKALCLAAQLGHFDVVQFLLEHGEDPNRYNPEGFHAHSTPLHQAALAGHWDVVKTLVEGGARLDLRDKIYGATPLGWAEHGGQQEVADYLRSQPDR